MAGERIGRRAARRFLAGIACLTVSLALSAAASRAADCPGNPGALGTARTLVVDPTEHPRIGTMQYGNTLPLAPGEVVLTFDDGPLPRYSNAVLDILAKECVKATFFVVGRMARAYPAGVRKMRDGGHSIGSHSQNHPLSFHRMSVDQARQEVNEGIASVTAALGGDAHLAPFFRIPGLLRAEAVEDYLASQGIQAWSADFPADDWRHISADQVYRLAMSRIAAKGKGILLLHDIQPRTVAALPRILQGLKAGGYRIVHVVQATPDRPKTPTDPQQWQRRPASDLVASARWPKVPSFVFATAEMLPIPSTTDLGVDAQRLLPARAPAGAVRRLARGEVPLPKPAPWPRRVPAESSANLIALPVPAESLFSMPERSQPAIRAMIPVQAQRAEGGTASAATDARDRAMPIDIRAAAKPISGSVAIAPEGLQRTPADLPARPRPLNR